LPPYLFDALLALAEDEELPLKTLVIFLLNSGINERLSRRARRGR
jgi:hypothetical protein